MNILAIDIGNTRVCIGAMRDGKAAGVERLPIDQVSTPAFAAAVTRVTELLANYPEPRVVICSVNPPAAESVVAAVATVADWPVLFIGSDIELPMPVDIDSPQTVGPDRVVAAAAAFEAVGGETVPVVVASLGTALTISAVSEQGHFLGGVICPGLRLGARALHQATARLPEVELATPAGPFGKSTVEAIQAGLFYQAVGVIREVVERMAVELGRWPHLVLTGGDAEAVAPAYEFVDSVVPNLSLLGINLAFRKHVEAMSGKR